MAGGIVRSDRGAHRILTRIGNRRPRATAALALVTLLVLAACAESGEPATLMPAPTLPVVTATPGPPPAPTPGEQQRYVVREGDTLSGIAARFGVSEDAILEENPLSDRDRLLVGQALTIPPAQP